MTTRKTEAEKLADRNVKMANRNALARSKANAESARKSKTTEPTREEVRASIREFAKQMSPAPEVKTVPKPTGFLTVDAESACLFALVRNA